MLDKTQATEQALAFLKKHQVGTVATAGADGKPHASPVYYIAEEDFSIYFPTSHNTEKFKSLVLNPHIAFSVGTGPEYTVVSIEGRAQAVGEDEREEVLAKLQKLVDAPMATWPIKAIPALEKSGIAVFKIKPDNVSFLDLTSEDQLDSLANYYYTIVP